MFHETTEENTASVLDPDAVHGAVYAAGVGAGGVYSTEWSKHSTIGDNRRNKVNVRNLWRISGRRRRNL